MDDERRGFHLEQYDVEILPSASTTVRSWPARLCRGCYYHSHFHHGTIHRIGGCRSCKITCLLLAPYCRTSIMPACGRNDAAMTSPTTLQAGLRCLLLSLLRARLGLRTGICSWLGARIGRSAACMSLPATLAPSFNARRSSS